MKLIPFILLCMAAPLSAGELLAPPTTGPARPPIIGLSHIALYCRDIDKSRAFYKDFLGFAEPYSLPNPDGTLHLTWIKINDQQTIELFPEKTPGGDRLYHIAIETTDATAMRDYLASRGVKVPDKVGKGKIGNSNYFITDPNGRIVEVVTYEQNGWTMINRGRFMSDTRISTHMPHVGILAGDLAADQHFYGDILGFHEIWRGGKKPDQLSWVHTQLADSKDFVELMLYSELPAEDKRGKYHHLCLEVPDIEKAKATLEERVARIGYTRPMEIQTGVNHKRQLNVYDPDGTRVELMEPNTIDGRPVPPSSAPPPTPRPATQPAT
jgi:catechol 2,3-dioxygenase-like lactoylglutathione lyase family enzyme